jgi:hypothetical protein
MSKEYGNLKYNKKCDLLIKDLIRGRLARVTNGRFNVKVWAKSQDKNRRDKPFLWQLPSS